MNTTPSSCIETFPLLIAWHRDAAVEAAGKAYGNFGAALRVARGAGLTKTCNRFHDSDERSPDIIRLPKRHDAMVPVVLAPCGWTEIRPTCEFLPDHEIDEEEWGTRRKPYSYRWPDVTRDEVLGRLLELNRTRPEEERLAGLPRFAPRRAPFTGPAAPVPRDDPPPSLGQTGRQTPVGQAFWLASAHHDCRRLGRRAMRLRPCTQCPVDTQARCGRPHAGTGLPEGVVLK